MQVIRYNTAAEFLDHAGTWLEQAEVENNLIIGIASYFASYVGELKTQPYFAYFQNQLPRKIADQSLFVWEDIEILSMAGIQRETRHGVAISWVLTPSHLRGRGHATSCVAALTQQMLDSGKSFCCLYADLANPTSNSIYLKIGYQPIYDVQHWVFDT